MYQCTMSVAIKHEKRISNFLLLLPVIEEIAWKHLVPTASPLEVSDFCRCLSFS